mmetsp:Transcript_16747/g.35986  ORF Transcript_16747/g.35986 Transcript_16747/m.35986 type:complete len:269 (-) Transcript_16747:2967-3773(-)
MAFARRALKAGAKVRVFSARSFRVTSSAVAGCKFNSSCTCGPCAMYKARKARTTGWRLMALAWASKPFLILSNRGTPLSWGNRCGWRGGPRRRLPRCRRTGTLPKPIEVAPDLAPKRRACPALRIWAACLRRPMESKKAMQRLGSRFCLLGKALSSSWLPPNWLLPSSKERDEELDLSTEEDESLLRAPAAVAAFGPRASFASAERGRSSVMTGLDVEEEEDDDDEAPNAEAEDAEVEAAVVKAVAADELAGGESTSTTSFFGWTFSP